MHACLSYDIGKTCILIGLHTRNLAIGTRPFSLAEGVGSGDKTTKLELALADNEALECKHTTVVNFEGYHSLNEHVLNKYATDTFLLRITISEGGVYRGCGQARSALPCAQLWQPNSNY